MVDQPANTLLQKILGQEIADVVVKTADLVTFVKQYTSLGELGAIISNFSLEGALGSTIAGITSSVGGIAAVSDTFNSIKDGYETFQNTVDITKNTINEAVDPLKNAYNDVKNTVDDVKSTAEDLKKTADEAKGVIKDAQNTANQLVSDAKGKVGEVKNLGKNAVNKAKGAVNKATKSVTSTISLPGELQGLGFESAMKNPKQMANLVAKELLPPIEEGASSLTDEEKIERQRKRTALLDSTLADVYGFAVSEEATDQNASISSAQKKVDKAETLQEKAGAALAVGLSRTAQLVRSNAYAAAQLRLLAAKAIADLPVDYSF